MQDPFILRQQRDFGQVVAGSFAYLRRHGRPLYRAIAITCLPVALLCAYIIGGAYSSLFNFSAAGNASSSGLMFIAAFVLMVIAAALMQSLTHEHLRAHEQGETVGMTSRTLLSRALGRIFHYFGIWVVSILTMGGASVVFILLFTFEEPVISIAAFLGLMAAVMALFTYTSLAPAAQAFERGLVTTNISRSFQLLRNAFWPTLGLWFVLYLLVGIVGYMVQLLGSLVMVLLMFLGASNDPEAARTWLPMFMSMLFGLQFCVMLFTYPIPAIGLALRYTTLIEEREGHGLKARMAAFEEL